MGVGLQQGCVLSTLLFITYRTGLTGAAKKCVKIGSFKSVIYCLLTITFSIDGGGWMPLMINFAILHTLSPHFAWSTATISSFPTLIVLVFNMKQELPKKAKFAVFHSIFVPILTYGHESWVMTERMRSPVQAFQIRFLHKIQGTTLLDKVYNFFTSKDHSWDGFSM